MDVRFLYLASQVGLGISLVSAAHVLNSIWATTPTRPFPWVLGVQTLTLVLIQQVFYLPNSLPKPPPACFSETTLMTSVLLGGMSAIYS